jgi:CDP-diacylglycerol--glycerol-3-phosphate 3-phosphatidyltransferase
MLTDVVDGPLARARGEVCYLGEVLDPIADKIFLDTVAVALAQTYGFPWWITGLILWRDVGIVTTGLLIYRHREYITPSMDIGKATTVALSTAMILYIADGPRSGKPALYVWLLLGILSVLLYWRRFVVLMRQRNQ